MKLINLEDDITVASIAKVREDKSLMNEIEEETEESSEPEIKEEQE